MRVNIRALGNVGTTAPRNLCVCWMWRGVSARGVEFFTIIMWRKTHDVKVSESVS